MLNILLLYVLKRKVFINANGGGLISTSTLYITNALYFGKNMGRILDKKS